MSDVIRVAQIVGKMNGGGVESFILNYYKHIDKSKIQFDFLVDNSSTYVPREEIESLGGRIIFIPPYEHTNKYIKELIRIFKEEKYLIVHSHINSLNVFPLFAAKKAGVPVRISHSHSTAGGGEHMRNIMKYILRVFSKIMPTHYFACSVRAANWLYGKRFYNKGNVEVIQNAINPEEFSYDNEIRQAKRKELGIENNFVIGNVGRLTHQKNHSFLIDIFYEVYKKDKSAVLLLVGMGELQEKIEKKVKALGIEKNVQFLGQRRDVNEIMQAFDLFLLPSFYEGLPVVGVEAQAAGLPCVLSAAISRETKILDTTEFISLRKSEVYWADRILKYRFYERKDQRKIIAERGFNIKEAAKKLGNLYIKYYNEIEK